MSSVSEIIASSDELRDFFGDRPLWHFAKLDLTVDQIHDEALGFGVSKKVGKTSDEKNDVAKLDRMKSLASACMNQCFKEIKQILDGSTEKTEVDVHFDSKRV